MASSFTAAVALDEPMIQRLCSIVKVRPRRSKRVSSARVQASSVSRSSPSLSNTTAWNRAGTTG